MSEQENSIRADPDILLSAIAKKRDRKKGGRLYLFIGMAPGVGKTYAMLVAAADAKRSLADVVVGVAETHGRKETEALLKGLEIIPKATIKYRNLEFLEMDLDAILARKPDIAIVDELAHTNIPGSRHNKRWQDVFELLDAGIDVYSTINVQHLESRKEAVEKIANITILETVPDSVLDRAFQIRLIDLSAPDLLRRLKEGKVYLDDKAEHAAANFFKEEKLTALREIALRLTAERVDTELQAFTTEKEAGENWAAAERLMVAVGYSKISETIIRSTRKMAYNLDAPWLAVHISNNKLVSENEKALLKNNLDLARNLGAEVITIGDIDVPEALIRIAKQRDITQIIVGRSKKKWFKDLFGRACIYDQLIQKSSIDIFVLGKKPKKERSILAKIRSIRTHSTPISLLKAVATSLLLLAINAPFISIIGYRAVGFILLLGILFTGLFLPIGSVLLSSIIMILGWNIFFVQPIGSLYINEPEDIFLCVSFLVSALATGALTRRIRYQQDVLITRELRAQTLNQILLDIAQATTARELSHSLFKHITIFLGGKSDILLRKKDTLSSFVGQTLSLKNENHEMAVAKWAMDNNKAAGHFTDTLSSAEALYIPLKGSFEMMGVLAYSAKNTATLSIEDKDFLFTVARQLAIHLENQKFRYQALESIHLNESEQLHQALLEVLVKEVKLFLNNGNNKNSLIFLMDNFLLASRITAGIFPLKKEQCDLAELVLLAKLRVQEITGFKELLINIQAEDHLPKVLVEREIIIQSLANILLNAVQHSKNKEIVVKISTAKISIFDQGPGLPEIEYGKSFDRFINTQNKSETGYGLGIFIAKSIIKAHEGKLTFSNESPGLKVSISFPK